MRKRCFQKGIAKILLAIILAMTAVLVLPQIAYATEEDADSEEESYDGFVVIDGKTYYYESGQRVSGWKYIDGDWYYFDLSSNVMVTRNSTIDKVYYKFGSDGKLLEGTWKTTVKGTRYYIAGSYLKGLQIIDGVIRYFDTSKGYMAINEVKTIAGVIYSFDENGVGTRYSLKIETEVFAVGSHCKIVVKDITGRDVAGATVYDITSGLKKEIGITDENGVIVTDVFSSNSGKYSVSASKNEDTSYIYYVYAVNEVGEPGRPFNILSHATVNGNTGKGLTWMVNGGSGKAIVRIALEEDYAAKGEAAFAEYEGAVEEKYFTGSDAQDYAKVNINRVVVEGLEAGKTYAYCVGDGEVWSDVGEFVTDAKDDSVNFFIIGDIQAKDLTNTATIIDKALSSGLSYSFCMQVGDSIEDASSYLAWNELLTCYGDKGLKSMDMVHVVGNHEYVGDVNASAARDIYNIPNSDYYSVEYDNVYIAVINYNANLNEASKWLIEDAGKSGARWKILATHQPPYYTNTSGGNKHMHSALPAAIDEAGINMVFSGHDHALARTLPIKSGEVNEEDGVVYYICGSTGVKGCSVTNAPEFHFAYVDDSYDAVYTTVQVTDEAIKVVNYNLDGSILDTYTMESKCSKNGHSYIYDGTSLVCGHCHKDTDVKSYIGFAKDAEIGKKMYLYLGSVKKGLVETSDGEYLFDENGLAIDGEYTVERMKYLLDSGKVLDKNGFDYYVTKNKSKKYLRMYRNGVLVQNAGWVQFEGNWYYVQGMNVITRDTGIDGVMYHFNADGTHTVGTFKDASKKIRYYFAGEMKIGLQLIEGKYYYFNLNDGNMYKNKTIEYEGFFYSFGPDGYAISVEEIPEIPSNGFCKEDGKTYYYDAGTKVVGWKNISDEWYYFTAEGVMATGNATIDKVQYRFGTDGKLLGGTWKTTVKGTRYYVAGSYVKGLQTIDGVIRYFSESKGYKVTNKSVTVDGVTYVFDEDGVGTVYVEPSSEEPAPEEPAISGEDENVSDGASNIDISQNTMTEEVVEELTKTE